MMLGWAGNGLGCVGWGDGLEHMCMSMCMCVCVCMCMCMCMCVCMCMCSKSSRGIQPNAVALLGLAKTALRRQGGAFDMRRLPSSPLASSTDRLG